ncbi:MAG: ABC transporter ATP-binding protein [Candidatus Aramenus sulfurataquae]|uniref:ABC transporter ATP-binding protein n=2 Tax=Candidatus Aramenus sulfurataquae TaxID=1326980 RepID=W7L852_9CREN|nr:MAG: ABC transporter ATP-binding protein [Candidatus Aramenus sulfurataquae]MCL7344536.1 ABC transporter ATP-binding protein [Candidatus Aramenus sulfurataquae]
MLIKGLKVKLSNKLVLDNVTVELKDGVNLILGPNGSGKTTLLRAIIGMVKSMGGELKVEGEKSYVPAEFFNAQMKVIDVLLSGGEGRLVEYLSYVDYLNLRDFLDRDFSTLSTGEKKLTLIAKALAEGDLVIMDEPTSGLDLRNSAKVVKVLREVKKTFIVATHDLNFLRIASWAILMKEGRVLFQGSPRDVDETMLTELYSTPVRKVEVDGNIYFLA